MIEKLTKSEQKVCNDIKKVIETVGLDYQSDILTIEKEARKPLLESIKDFYIRGHIIQDYVFIDEMLNVIIINSFGKNKFSQKKNRVFKENILEKIYLIQKIEIVKSFIKIPSNIEKTIFDLNSLRNGLAHTFFVHKRKVNKPIWKKKNIYKVEVFEECSKDLWEVKDFLMEKAYNIKNASSIDFRI